MPLQLPDGYVDTGITRTFVLSGSVAVFMWPASVTGTTSDADKYMSINEWTLYGVAFAEFDGGCDPSTPYSGYLQAIASHPLAGETVLETVTQTCVAGVAGQMSGAKAFEQTEGPYRLGAKLQTISGEPTDPLFATSQEVLYAWFADENTVRNSSLGSASAPEQYYTELGWSTTPSAPFTPVQAAPPSLTWVATIEGSGISQSATDPEGVFGQFTGLTAEGGVPDTSSLQTDMFVGLGSGNVNARRINGSPISDTASCECATEIHYDFDLPLFGGIVSSGVTVTSSSGDSFAVPYTATELYQDCSWIDDDAYFPETFSIAPDPPEYPADDVTVPLWAAPARLDPATGNQYYQPVTVELEEPIELELGFENETLDKLNIIDGPDQLDVEAFALGGSVRKEYGASGTDLPAWRQWLGVGTLGHADPAFNPDLSHTTAFDWDWTSYRYLRVDLTAPALGTVKLTVEGVHLTIEDPHTTGSDRPDNFVVTETPYEVTYSIDVTATGPNFYYVDLCFPDAATEPFYHSRIDAIRIHDWPLGDWILNDLSLYSLETAGLGTRPGEVNLKVGFGAPVQRGDYSALHASHNGSNFSLNLGDQDNKPEEVGTYGGALRYINILTGAVTGIIQDSQLSLEAFWAQLDSVAGWSVTWDDAAHETANEDSFGASFGAGLAQWSRPGAFTFDAGSPGYEPKCHPVVKKITPATGMELTLYTRHPVYGSAEAIATRGGAPARTVSASFGGVTATTDTHGWVAFPGVPPGTTLPGHAGALTPRDRPRVLIVVPAELGDGLANLAVPLMNWYLEAWVEAGNVQVGFAPWVTPPFQHTAQVTSTGDASHPELYHRRGRIYALWQRGTSSPTVYRAYSDDWGRTWNPPEVVFVGGKYPRAATCPNTFTVVECAYLSGGIIMRRQTPGQATPSATFSPSGIGAVADEPFDIAWHGDARRRLILVVNDGAAIRRYQSWDQGTSFTLVV